MDTEQDLDGAHEISDLFDELDALRDSRPQVEHTNIVAAREVCLHFKTAKKKAITVNQSIGVKQKEGKQICNLTGKWSGKK